MRLAAMRYKGYVWPHNPRVYTIDFARQMGTGKVPFGRFYLQDLGLSHRVIRGEGEFVGPGAYEEFKKLASVFYQDGPGLLVHPVWQSANAYFTALSLQQEPRADYVKYAFTFWEGYDGQSAELKTESSPAPPPGGGGQGSGEHGAIFHTVARGETLWVIANRYGLSLTALISMNSQIKNPNLILVGEKVRVK